MYHQHDWSTTIYYHKEPTVYDSMHWLPHFPNHQNTPNINKVVSSKNGFQLIDILRDKDMLQDAFSRHALET